MKTFIVILLATLSAAVGEVLLSYGMRRSGQMDIAEPSQWFNLVFSVVRNPYIFMGVVLLGIFFFLFLAALSWADLSFVLPLTAMTYIFAALLARFILREHISWFRWIGTIVIIIGIFLIALDSRQRSADYRVKEYQGSGSNPDDQSTERKGGF